LGFSPEGTESRRQETEGRRQKAQKAEGEALSSRQKREDIAKMADMRVRRAVAEDAAAIASIMYESFAEFRPLYTPGGFSATAIRAEEVMVRLNEGPVWVALWEDSICGTVAAVGRGAALYVRGMAVLPRVRGKGAGEALLKQVEIFATERGHVTLLLTTTPFLDSAIRLYEKFGFYRTEGGSTDLFGTPLFWMEKKLAKLR
jgi:GNAT superfamily N-acetyltransferase